MLRLSHLLLYIAAVGLITPAQAQEEKKWYEVEVIVFARDSADAAKEHWPEDPGVPVIDKAAELLPALEASSVPADYASYKRLPPAMLQLMPVKQRVETDGEFRILTHVGWVLAVEKGGPAGMLYLDDTAGAPPAAEETPASNAPIAPPVASPPLDAAPTVVEVIEPKEPIEPRDRAFYGTASVVQSRFMHLAFDLLLRATPAAPPASAAEPAFPMAGTAAPQAQALPITLPGGYRLRESRRITPGQIQYYDHPAFGVVAQVRAIETAKAAESRNTPAPAKAETPPKKKTKP